MITKLHDLYFVGKLGSSPSECSLVYVCVFFPYRDIHQTLDKSRTCQCFLKSLYNKLKFHQLSISFQSFLRISTIHHNMAHFISKSIVKEYWYSIEYI